MFNKIKIYLANSLGFSYSETKGFIVLMFIIVIALIIPFIVNIYQSENNNTDFQVIKTTSDAIIKIEQKQNNKNSHYKKYSNNKFEENEYTENRKTVFHNFNPNTATENQFNNLGIPIWLSKRIFKYRQKGGSFRQKEDLLKIYDFPENLYTQLEPYIQIPDNKFYQENIKELSKTTENTVLQNRENHKINHKQPTTFDFNLADTNDLKQIKGIGSKISARIIKYRDKLGGFYSENQLKEVYGLDSTTIQECLKYGYIKSPIKNSININTISQENFKHLYIKPYQAKIIIAYRNQHGPFKTKEDFSKIYQLDKETLDKIYPYFVF